MYLHSTEDVRNYINTHLMGDGLTYQIDTEFDMWVKHQTRTNANLTLTKVLYIQKVQRYGRPRLFGKDNSPIELSYCDTVSLRDAFTDYSAFLEKKQVRIKTQKYVEELSKFSKESLDKLMEDNNIEPARFDFDIEALNDLSNAGIIRLEALHKKVEALCNVIAMKAVIFSKPYEELTAEEKYKYHSIRWYLKGAKRRLELDFASMWQEAHDYNVDAPVLHNCTVWTDEAEDFLAMLKQYNLHKIYFAENGSIATRLLYKLINGGMTLEGTALLKYQRPYGDSTLEAIVFTI